MLGKLPCNTKLKSGFTKCKLTHVASLPWLPAYVLMPRLGTESFCSHNSGSILRVLGVTFFYRRCRLKLPNIKTLILKVVFFFWAYYVAVLLLSKGKWSVALYRRRILVLSLVCIQAAHPRYNPLTCAPQDLTFVHFLFSLNVNVSVIVCQLKPAKNWKNVPTHSISVKGRNTTFEFLLTQPIDLHFF